MKCRVLSVFFNCICLFVLICNINIAKAQVVSNQKKVSAKQYKPLVYGVNVTPADVNFQDYLEVLRDKRVALVMNQTSRIGYASLLDTLLSMNINVKKIFVPEHGFRGIVDAGSKVESYDDSATGIPVISLYGDNKKPTDAQLKNIDVMVYDLQDVGVRFFTYISTLEYTMEACAENNIDYVILDRPNPNGFYVDGPVLDPSVKSIVGMQRIPIVYGMTAGEYGKMLVGEHLFHNAEKARLRVVRCHNYEHKTKYRLSIPPSPNLKSMTAVYAYPSMCLFEGTQVSVGRGTYLPFQIWGHPDYVNIFKYSFIPRSTVGAKNPLYQDKTCYGELVGANEEEVLKKLGNKVRLNWLIKAYGAFRFQDKFFNAFFVKLAGNPKLEQQIKQGVSEEDIRKTWEPDIKAFKQIRKKYLLYHDFE